MLMKTQETKRPATQASRRGFLTGLFAGVGATAAVLAGKAKAQGAKSTGSGPVLFHRTAETERYYKTVMPR
jgi:hypothetical protein